jgi:sarcosine oxidase subunit gamma
MTRRTDVVMAERAVGPLEGNRDALAAVATRTGGAVMLAVEPPATHVVFRGEPSDEVLRAVRAATGVDLPIEPNRVATGGQDALADRACWLGPDEWLLVAPLERRTRLVAALEAARGGRHLSVVDVSAGRCSIVLSGPGSRALLATGCGLDLDPRVHGRGSCAQTALARAAVLIEVVGEGEAYRITLQPSFARYLAGWLIDAASEFEPAFSAVGALFSHDVGYIEEPCTG